MNKNQKPSLVQKYVPITKWLPKYNKAWLSKDIIAGFSVWALMVPEALGYATISGVPLQYGLYAAGIGLIIYAIFASSKHVITGPSSALAAISGAAVLSAGATGSAEAVSIVATISIIAGFLYLIMGVFKMGWISNFLAASVLTGFIFGIGIEVIVGQLGNLTGTTVTGSNAWTKIFSWLSGLPDLNKSTLIIGVGSLLLLLILRKLLSKVPGVLIILIVGIAVSTYFGLSDKGVEIIGEIPTGLPMFTLPSVSFILNNFSVILAGAIGIFMIAFSESIATARLYATKHNYQIDTNQEMLAQGFANTTSGLFQGISVAGSLSKSALNESSGTKSQMSSLVQGLLVFVTLLFLAPIFTNLPEVVLAAIVIYAVAFGLLNVKEMKRIYKYNRTEFWVAMMALFGVVTFGTLQGVLIGLIISLLVVVFRASKPSIPLLGKLASSDQYVNLENNPSAKAIPNVAIIRIDSALFFPNVEALSSRVQEITSNLNKKVKIVLIDMENVNYIDLEGSDMLIVISSKLLASDIELHLVNIKQSIHKYLLDTNVIKSIGKKNIHKDMVAAEKGFKI